MGPDAHLYLDWLTEAGFSAWQVLPLGPPGPGASPYQADSAHAGSPGLISPIPLQEAGWLVRDAVPADWLERAATRFLSLRANPSWGEYQEFVTVNAQWLDDYARYRVIKNRMAGAPWWLWPEELRHRQPDTLTVLDAEEGEALDRVRVVQWFFHRQWQAVRAHAHECGIALFGDLPIYVAHDSVETWQRPELFTLDRDGHLIEVAGVPPDAFSATGQLWGNPLYRWDVMASEGFAWWIERLQTELKRVDWLRVDHFRGFAACWVVSADASDARQGEWREVPGHELFVRLTEVLGQLPLVAEDLGLITPDVVALREGSGLPGMAVLQFAFDGGTDNPYLPYNHHRDCVIYTGTHDNDTTLGWWQGLDEGTRGRILEILGHPSEPMPWPMIRAALGSVADLAIIPLQDLLGLDGRARMNRPGTEEGNWRWRCSEADLRDRELARRLHELCSIYGRLD